jgi:transcriptional regulator with XRE-family HTH domain
MQDTQDVDQDYEDFLKLIAERIKAIRLDRKLTLRDMVVDHGYHDSNYRRIEREGAGGVQSLLRLCKAFEVTLSDLLDGLGKYPKQDLTSIAKNIARETSKLSKAKEKKSSPAQER